MRNVEILYVEGCPNRDRTQERILEIGRELGVAVAIRTIRIDSHDQAVRERFVGSPTVRVDGADIDPQRRKDYALSCRLYGGQGVPPREMIAAALLSDGRPPAPGARATRGGIVGSLVVAALSASCCWLPPLLALVGVSATGWAILEMSRPWALGLSVLLLGWTAWLAERRAVAPPDCCTGAGRRRLWRNRALLAGTALGVAALGLLPPAFELESSAAVPPGESGGSPLAHGDACGCNPVASDEGKVSDAVGASLFKLEGSIRPLVSRFNAHADRVRYLAILSPG